MWAGWRAYRGPPCPVPSRATKRFFLEGPSLLSVHGKKKGKRERKKKPKLSFYLLLKMYFFTFFFSRYRSVGRIYSLLFSSLHDNLKRDPNFFFCLRGYATIWYDARTNGRTDGRRVATSLSERRWENFRRRPIKRTNNVFKISSCDNHFLSSFSGNLKQRASVLISFLLLPLCRVERVMCREHFDGGQQ